MKILFKAILTVAALGVLSIAWELAIQALNAPNALFLTLGVIGILIEVYLVALVIRMWKPEIVIVWDKIREDFLVTGELEG